VHAEVPEQVRVEVLDEVVQVLMVQELVFVVENMMAERL